MPIVIANPAAVPTSWDLANISSDGVSYNSPQLGSNGVSFKPDGTKMYIASSSGSLIGEYDLSTPWVVSSASQVQTKGVASDPREVVLSSDGTTAYVCSNGADLIYQYTLSTPWTFNSVVSAGTFNPSDASPTGIYLRSDGLKMYVCANGGNLIKQYALSSAWDITSAGALESSFSVGTQEGVPTNVSFNSAGTRMFVAGYTGSAFQYDLGTPWTVSSAVYNSVFAALGTGGRPSIAFKPDGTKMYAVNDGSPGTSVVYQFSL